MINELVTLVGMFAQWKRGTLNKGLCLTYPFLFKEKFLVPIKIIREEFHNACVSNKNFNVKDSVDSSYALENCIKINSSL